MTQFRNPPKTKPYNHTRSGICRLLIALLAGIAFPAVSRAELPPRAYEEMQARAPEDLELRVLAVADVVNLNSLDRSTEEHSVTAQAEVVRVLRSQSGLKVGDSIRLEYKSVFHRAAGVPGPGPVTIVEQGARYRAYLEKQNGVLVPAAMGESLNLLRDANSQQNATKDSASLQIIYQPGPGARLKASRFSAGAPKLRRGVGQSLLLWLPVGGTATDEPVNEALKGVLEITLPDRIPKSGKVPMLGQTTAAQVPDRTGFISLHLSWRHVSDADPTLAKINDDQVTWGSVNARANPNPKTAPTLQGSGELRALRIENGRLRGEVEVRLLMRSGISDVDDSANADPEPGQETVRFYQETIAPDKSVFVIRGTFDCAAPMGVTVASTLASPAPAAQVGGINKGG